MNYDEESVVTDAHKQSVTAILKDIKPTVILHGFAPFK